MFSKDSVALIDADSIYFRIACVTKNKKEIRKAINYSMTEIRRNVGTDKLLSAVKGSGNFRHDIYPQYKANRKELDADLREALNYGHQYMCDYHSATRADGMEADDLVAIWAHECMELDQDYTIVGIDKDLLQIPGAHYNFIRKTHKTVDADEGHLNLMLQCLTGDTADNIPGIRGIGPKKAKDILQGVNPNRRWDRVRAAWRMHKAGDPLLSWRLLTMLTSWEELNEVQAQCETSECKQDVLEGKEKEDNRISTLSE